MVDLVASCSGKEAKDNSGNVDDDGLLFDDDEEGEPEAALESMATAAREDIICDVIDD
jgi:hypothetical protein